MGEYENMKKIVNYNNSLENYSEEILKKFLISTTTPKSEEEKRKIEIIFKNLSLLIWVGKFKILTKKEEEKIIGKLQKVCEDFKFFNLIEKTNHIIENIKYLNEKIAIIEHLTEIEYKSHTEKIDIDKSILLEFEKIAKKVNSTSDKFSIMQIERELKDIKVKYFKNPENTSSLFEKLKNIVIKNL